MKIIIKLVLAFSLCFSPLSQAQNLSMITTNWPPFYANELDQGGFISKIVAESFKASGYGSDIEFTQWQTAMDKVKAGDKDVLVGAYYSEQRAQDYHVSMPIYSVMTGIIKRQDLDLDFYSSFEMLNQYKLGKMAGSVISKSFDVFQFQNLQGFDSTEAGVKALANQEIHLYADSLAVVKATASKIGVDANTLTMVQPPIEQNDLYVMISKQIQNAEKVRDDFNAGFLMIQANGTYEKILKEFNQL